MLCTGAGVLLIRHGHDNRHRVNHRKHQQKARAVADSTPTQTALPVRDQRIQQSRYFHTRLPTASHRQRRPPHKWQRQQQTHQGFFLPGVVDYLSSPR